MRHPEPDVHIAGDPLGRTYTPDAVALACCRALAAMGCDPLIVSEPCVGGGAFVRAVAEVWPRSAGLTGWIDVADLDHHAPGLRSNMGSWAVEDAADPVAARSTTGRYDLIITNPPFGEEAGDVDVRIYAAQRPACDWLALLMPVEHACLQRWAGPMQSAVIVPLTGRVWSVVRGMALYVWGPGIKPLHPPITHGGRA
jgi:hypothetical protein